MKVPNEQLDLLKRYLTKEEAKEIMPLFEKNYNKNFFNLHKERVYDGGEIVSRAFNWAKSPEGDDYWYEIYKKVEERIRIEEKQKYE